MVLYILSYEKLGFGLISKIAFGAIDGTPLTVPLNEQPKYIGRHGYASQNVMAVRDFDMRFIFVVTGWPGSVHDRRVLLDTLVTYKEQFPHPPEGINHLHSNAFFLQCTRI